MSPYFQDDSVTIYHGDCRDILPTLDPVDLVLTDPPYGQNTHAMAKTNKGAGHGVKAIHFDYIPLESLKEILTLCATKCPRWTIGTMEWRHVAAMEEAPPVGLRFMRMGVWIKTNGMPQISADRPAQGWEAIAYFHSSLSKPKWHGGGAFWQLRNQSRTRGTSNHEASGNIRSHRSAFQRLGRYRA